MEKVPERRWLAKVERGAGPDIEQLPDDVHLYAPMTAQLRNEDHASFEKER